MSKYLITTNEGERPMTPEEEAAFEAFNIEQAVLKSERNKEVSFLNGSETIPTTTIGAASVNEMPTGELRPNSPSVTIGCVANLYSRMMHFKNAGDTEVGHTHAFDHLTLLASGSIRLIVEGKVSDFKAPHMIYIHKDKIHEVIALENNTVAYCIHALRDQETSDILDPNMIPEGVPGYEVAQSVCGKRA
jgi:hypothetical protein